jgi:hypothetical protein
MHAVRIAGTALVKDTVLLFHLLGLAFQNKSLLITYSRRGWPEKRLIVRLEMVGHAGSEIQDLRMQQIRPLWRGNPCMLLPNAGQTSRAQHRGSGIIAGAHQGEQAWNSCGPGRAAIPASRACWAHLQQRHLLLVEHLQQAVCILQVLHIFQQQHPEQWEVQRGSRKAGPGMVRQNSCHAAVPPHLQ